ncbi:MAG: hypothetical protein RL428_646, partial [Actinomycetota bacterium]
MRVALAAAYEPGSLALADEINDCGIEEVFQKIPSEEVIDVEKVYQSLDEIGATILIPEDAMWPPRLNHLAAPPVALFVRGDVEILSMQSLAIVGTRNPTQYGLRIAQEFAAGFVDR